MTDSSFPFKGVKLKFGSQTEVSRRDREIQVLINIAEPDPEVQPYGFTDAASILDAVGVEPDVIQRRFDAYFEERLGIPLDTPLWKYVDEVKRLRPNWLKY